MVPEASPKRSCFAGGVAERDRYRRGESRLFLGMTSLRGNGVIKVPPSGRGDLQVGETGSRREDAIGNSM